MVQTPNAMTPAPWRFSAEIGGIFARVNGRPVTVAANVSIRNGYVLAAAPELHRAVADFVAFAEYHELRKLFPRIETQLCGMRAALAAAQSALGGGLVTRTR